MKFLNNQSGFSLVQVMVAFGLMGGLAVVMMQMTEGQMKSQKTMELKAEVMDVANTLRQVITDKDACKSTFIGMAPGESVGEIRMNDNMNTPAFAEVAQQFKNSNVYIKEMRLLTRAEEISPAYGLRKVENGVEELAIQPETGKGYAYLRVLFVKGVRDTKSKQTFYGAKETAEIFRIKGVFSNIKVLAACTAPELTAMCDAEATGNGVYKMGEYIPNTNPPTQVDVAGCTGGSGYMYKCSLFHADYPITDCVD